MAALLKTTAVLLLLTCFITVGYSQSLSMDVMASSGNEFTDEEFSLSWTIGENFTETFVLAEGFQTLGFHQSETDNELPVAEAADVWFFPNPVSGSLTIRSKDSIGGAVIKVVAISGKTVLERQIRMESSYTLNLSWLTKGTYHLQIINDKSQNFTFLKL